MKNTSRYFVIGSVLSLSLSCIDPYNPPIKEEEVNYLVIDGLINSSENKASVKLSRAIGITNNNTIQPETGALVTIEDEANNIVTLDEGIDGMYTKQAIFNSESTYQLKIQTKGKTYNSDYITIEKNAPIDSLQWQVENDQFMVFSFSHDFSKSVGYYKYISDETYEYRAPLFSFYKYENGQMSDRLPDYDIYHCWMSQSVNDRILVASSENKTQNAILNFKTHSIPKGDKRLWNKYSIQVSQIAIDKSAYEFWSQLKNINEGVGGLFDPIPYSVKGNIRNTNDPSETVLGYFYGGEVTTKRIVVRNIQLPGGFQNANQTNCVEDLVSVGNISSLEGKDVIVTNHLLALTTIIGYYYTTPICGDCRLQGGTTVAPDYMK